MKATNNKNLSGTRYARNGKRISSAVLRSCAEALEGRTLLSGFGFGGGFGGFGQHGPVLTPFSGAQSDTVSSLVAEPNGSLVAVGNSSTDDITYSSAVSLARYTSAGTLDPKFGNGGKIKTTFPDDDAYSPSAALEADQKILVVTPVFSTTSYVQSSILTRYTTAGQLDPSFGSGGEVPVLAGVNSNDFVAVLPNGEIVVAGGMYDYSTSSETFVLEEYQANGALDTSFGTNGRVTTLIGSSASLDGIAAQGNDIVVAGETSSGTPAVNELLVARYTAAGTLDASFGTAGLAAYPTYDNGNVSGVAVGPDGSIFVAGRAQTATYTAFVTHLAANGALDSAYGSGGTGTISGIAAAAIAVQSNGDAVVAADSGTGFAVGAARFTASGAPDGTFGTGGVVTTAFTPSDTTDAVAIEPQGAGTKIVIAGTTGFQPGTDDDFLLARYTTSGVLDTSFGSGGSVTTNFVGPVSAAPQSVISDGHGGTLVGGATGSANGALAVADYLPNGQLNPDFGNDGTVQVTFNSYIFSTFGGYLAVQNDGKILLVGTSIQPGTTNYDFAIARLLPDGKLDKSFGVGGEITTFSGANFTDMGASGGIVIQPNGKFLVAGYTEGYGGSGYVDNGVVVRYDPDGSIDTTFGTAGRETFPLPGAYPDRTTAIALEPNGEILVGGFVSVTPYGSENYVLEKLHANGTPDTAFAPGGQIVTSFSAYFMGLDYFDYAGPDTLLLRPDGKILVGGTTYNSATGQSYMTVAQFTAAGAPDLSFGSGGQASVSFTGDPNFTGVSLNDIALLPGGKVLLVGSYYAEDPNTYQQTTGDFALAEFTSAGNLNTSFGTGGSELSSFGGGLLSAAAVQVQCDGTFQVVGSSYDPTTQLDDFALAEYYPDGTLILARRRH